MKTKLRKEFGTDNYRRGLISEGGCGFVYSRIEEGKNYFFADDYSSEAKTQKAANEKKKLFDDVVVHEMKCVD